MATQEELQATRDQLYNAFISLISGSQVAEIWRDGRRITFRAGSKDALRAEYEALDRQIAAFDSAKPLRPPFRGIGIVFGGPVG